MDRVDGIAAEVEAKQREDICLPPCVIQAQQLELLF